MAESVAILCNALSHESDLAEGATAPVRSLPVQGEVGRKKGEGVDSAGTVSRNRSGSAGAESIGRWVRGSAGRGQARHRRRALCA